MRYNSIASMWVFKVIIFTGFPFIADVNFALIRGCNSLDFVAGSLLLVLTQKVPTISLPFKSIS